MTEKTRITFISNSPLFMDQSKFFLSIEEAAVWVNDYYQHPMYDAALFERMELCPGCEDWHITDSFEMLRINETEDSEAGDPV